MAQSKLVFGMSGDSRHVLQVSGEAEKVVHETFGASHLDHGHLLDVVYVLSARCFTAGQYFELSANRRQRAA